MATDLTAASAAPLPPRDDHPPRLRRVLVVAAVAVALAVGVVAARQATRAGPASDRIGDEGAAPAFDLPQVASPVTRVSLAQYAGRPVVVNFWASWCVPCRTEMPALEALSERLRGQVAFVGINYQDVAKSAAEFEAEVGVRYPSGSDTDGGVARRYGVLGLPTTVLIDADGRIVARRLGEVTEQELGDLIERAFAPAARKGPS